MTLSRETLSQMVFNGMLLRRMSLCRMTTPQNAKYLTNILLNYFLSLSGLERALRSKALVNLIYHGQTSANRTKPGQSFQL
jgi:hypothetical protein